MSFTHSDLALNMQKMALSVFNNPTRKCFNTSVNRRMWSLCMWDQWFDDKLGCLLCWTWRAKTRGNESKTQWLQYLKHITLLQYLTDWNEKHVMHMQRWDIAVKSYLKNSWHVLELKWDCFCMWILSRPSQQSLYLIMHAISLLVIFATEVQLY